MKNINFLIEKVFAHPAEGQPEKLAGYFLTINHTIPKQENIMTAIMGTLMSVAEEMERKEDGEAWKQKQKQSKQPEKIFFSTEKELRDFIVYKLSEF